MNMYDELKRLRLLTDALINADEKLEESTHKWEYALNAIPNLVFITDTSMVVKFVNQPMCDAFREEPDHFINKTCYETIARCPDRDLCHCNRYGNEDVISLEDTFIPGAGRWYNHTKSPIYESGSLIGYICVLTDITERKLYEDALIKREAMLNAVYKSTPAGIGVATFDRKIIWVNDKMYSMLGYEEEELSNRDVRILYSDENTYVKTGEEKYKQITKTGTGTVETKWRKKDGTIIDVLLSSTKMDEDNRIAFAAQDITYLKNTERELLKDEDRLESLLRLSQLQNVSEVDLIDEALEACVKLTGSKIGYFHFYNPNEITLGLFTWSKNAMVECKSGKDLHYPLEKAGIWADCIRNRAPVIHNDYESIAKVGKLPEGHVDVKRHMSIPVFNSSGSIVAVVGVGNKEEPYDHADVRQLQLFMESLWKTISASRATKELERIIVSLRKTCQDS